MSPIERAVMPQLPHREQIRQRQRVHQQDVGPLLRQLAPARHVGVAIVDRLDAVGDVREHQVDHLAIVAALFLVELVVVVILFAFPQLSLFLPSLVNPAAG